MHACCLGFYFFQQAYYNIANVDGMKDLWCSIASIVWLLSTQIRMGRRIYSAHSIYSLAAISIDRSVVFYSLQLAILSTQIYY